MARTKQTAKRHRKPIVTWTRFHLPREQEWPTWPKDRYEHIYWGPLADLEGLEGVSVARMVDNPERAAYVLQWATLDDLRNFQASTACAQFLQNLPEHDDSGISVESGSAIRHLSLDHASSSSPPSSPSSRFLTLHHATERATLEAEGRVTFTSFMVPRAVDDPNQMWEDVFWGKLECFVPSDVYFITGRHNFWFKSMSVWFRVLDEDRWVEEKFGKLEGDGQGGRTVFCQFWLWREDVGLTLEHEEASAANLQARESWREAIAGVMPPAAAWVQERWDIRHIPYIPEPDSDPDMNQ